MLYFSNTHVATEGKSTSKTSDIKKMQKTLHSNDIVTIFFHLGAKYRKHLIPKREDIDVECKVPLLGLRIGKKYVGTRNMIASNENLYQRLFC